MQRYFMELSYRGAPFHGWQRQPNAISVQEVIEEGLSTLLRKRTAITGAGRTDTGVNARKMVAHFDAETEIADGQRFVRALNTLSGHDIAVHGIRPVAPEAHARFDATSRTYHYYVISHKSPFLYGFAWQAPQGLDYEKMNRAAALLLDTDDFTSFAKLHTDAKTNICHVTEARWIEDRATGGHVFVITADRFLRNMVRAVVGTLVDVGRGKIDIDGFRRIIDERDRCSAGTSMPGHALYLWDVTYPY